LAQGSGGCASAGHRQLGPPAPRRAPSPLQMASKGVFTTPLAFGHNESYFPPVKDEYHALQLVAGPSIMGLALVLQTIKKNMTGEHASKLYQHIWKFISKAEARDKVGRIVQYGCRCLQGFLAHMPAGAALQAYKPVIAEIQTTLAWARRTHRWGKAMPHVPALGEAISKGDVLEAAQRAVLITFLVQDHVYWLLKVGLLKFKNYSAIQWHRRNLRFITFSHVLNFSLCVREIRRIRDKQKTEAQSEEALAKSESAIYDNKRMMVRYVLTFFQILHVSQVKAFDDWYIGIFGMISSYIDASKQW